MKVFISSTYMDLIDHRARVAEAVERLGQQGVRMEVFGARPAEATTASLEEVEESDVFVGIYAHRFGHVPLGTSSSISQMEFEFARKLNKPTFCFIVNDEYPWPPKFVESEPGRNSLENFKRRIADSLVQDTFTSPEDLAFKVTASLGRFLLKEKVKSELTKAAKSEPAITDQFLDQLTRRTERLLPIIKDAQVLLVNDIPQQVSHVIQILRDLKVHVDIAMDTDSALDMLAARSYHAVVSDMARDSVEDAGIKLLTKMRMAGLYRPIIFTVGNFNPERGTPAYAFGITNRVDELLNLLFDILERTKG